jgi:type II secretory pathway predicted ATPase ExeA
MIGPLTECKDGGFSASIGSAEAVLMRPRRAELECEGAVIASRALSRKKAKISVSLLVAGLFYHLSSTMTVSIPNRSE